MAEKATHAAGTDVPNASERTLRCVSQRAPERAPETAEPAAREAPARSPAGLEKQAARGPSGDPAPTSAPTSAPTAEELALELVATRGKEVLAVRHLAGRARAHLGQTGDSIVRMTLPDASQRRALIAEARTGRFRLCVPRQARLRLSGADGLGRVAIGPASFDLSPGDRAVLVVDDVQIRARVVPMEELDLAPKGRRSLRWFALVAAVYAAIVAVAVAVAPEGPAPLSPSDVAAAEPALVE